MKSVSFVCLSLAGLADATNQNITIMKVFAVYPTIEYVNTEYIDNDLTLVTMDGDIIKRFPCYNSMEYLRKKKGVDGSETSYVFDVDEFDDAFYLTFRNHNVIHDTESDLEQYAKTVVKELFDLDIVKFIYI